MLVFPPQTEGERWLALPFFWVPEEDIHERARRDRVPYDVWRRQGFIEATPGNATDYKFVEAAIVRLAGLYNIRAIAFDRTFAGEIIQNLQEELGHERLIQFGQGFLSMASPTAELLRLLKAGDLQHGGHPVLRWNASNLALASDAAGNQKPDKLKSSERIDGLSALVMAIGLATVTPAPQISIYDQRAKAGDGPIVRAV